MKLFRQRLYDLRKERKYSQRLVAEYLGVKQPSYIRYEKGNSEPSLANLIKLAELYGVSVDYLLGR